MALVLGTLGRAGPSCSGVLDRRRPGTVATLEWSPWEARISWAPRGCPGWSKQTDSLPEKVVACHWVCNAGMIDHAINAVSTAWQNPP